MNDKGGILNTLKPYTPAETRRKKGESYLSSCSRVMNNFHLKFPVGNVPHHTGEHAEGYLRGLARQYWWNVLYGDRFPSANDGFHSEKMLCQTGAQFYGEIDATVEKLGILMTRVSEVVNRVIYTEDPKEGEEQLYKNMWKILLPIYIALRKKRYSQQDLKG